MLRYLHIVLVFVALTGACSVDRSEHRQVAKSFVEQLNQCLNEPSEANQNKLTQYCSSYTYSLSQNSVWAMRVVSAGPFRYMFVGDSLSCDKMKAYVWFSNALQPDFNSPCLELRQSLDGWVVDMPLF